VVVKTSKGPRKRLRKVTKPLQPDRLKREKDKGNSIPAGHQWGGKLGEVQQTKLSTTLHHYGGGLK